MPASLTDFIVEYPDAISDDLCDRLIEKFEDSPELTYGGQTGSQLNLSREEGLQTKISEDLFITTLAKFQEEDAELTERLGHYLQDYHNYMAQFSITYRNAAGILDKGFQMQKTTPGGGYGWYTDEYVGCLYDSIAETEPGANGSMLLAAYERRMYTYIFYLNDKFEGGLTEFVVGSDEITK